MVRLLGVNEVAERFGLSTRTVARLREAGEITGVKIGRRVLFHENEVEAFITRAFTKAEADE